MKASSDVESAFFSLYIQRRTGVRVLPVVEEITTDAQKPAHTSPPLAKMTKDLFKVASLSQRHLSQKAPVLYHTTKIAGNKFTFLKYFLQ